MKKKETSSLKKQHWNKCKCLLDTRGYPSGMVSFPRKGHSMCEGSEVRRSREENASPGLGKEYEKGGGTDKPCLKTPKTNQISGVVGV